MKKICELETCGKEFDSLRASRKYCSVACFQKASQTIHSISKTKEDRIVVDLSSDEPLVIAVLADAHGNLEYIKYVVSEVQKHDNWYIMINGDLWDADQYSTHPTLTVKSLSESVQEVKELLLPVADKIIGYVWGNHEERCFRSASGKGTAPSYFDIFFEAIKARNPNFRYALPMQSFIINVTVKGKLYKTIFKHGKSAGRNFGVTEFHEILDVNSEVNVIVLSHLHLPMHIIVKQVSTESIEEEENSFTNRTVHLVRTTSGIAFAPYQDKANLYVSPMGITKLIFNGDLKVELI